MLTGGYYGQGSSPIMLDDVRCMGSETNIAFCNTSVWYKHNCGHHEDVGVICDKGNIHNISLT